MEDNKIHCKFCRELISENALICPYCNKKTNKQIKKELIKQLIKLLILFFILILIRFCN